MSRATGPAHPEPPLTAPGQVGGTVTAVAEQTAEPAPEQRRGSLREQLGSMARVGLIGFGGGSVLIPVMQRELVDRRGALDEKTFLQHTVIANITPGALPVKLAGLSATRLGPAWWVLASALAVTLPGTLLAIGLIASFDALGEGGVRIIEYASVGISAFILALLTHYVLSVLGARSIHRVGAVAVFLATFVATGMRPVLRLLHALTGVEPGFVPPRMSVVQVILVTLGTIVVWHLVSPAARRRHREHREHRAEPALAPDVPGRAMHHLRVALAYLLGSLAISLVLAAVVGGLRMLRLAGLVALSTVTSFGGGESYVAVADGVFVAGGYVSAETFYGQMVPVANALPGPILVKIAAQIGYDVGAEEGGAVVGWIMAGTSLLAAVVSSTVIALLVMSVYQKAQRSPMMHSIGVWILPVVAGLLATTSVAMLDASAGVGERSEISPVGVTVASVLAVAAIVGIQRRRNLHDLVVLGVCGAVAVPAMVLCAR